MTHAIKDALIIALGLFVIFLCVIVVLEGGNDGGYSRGTAKIDRDIIDVVGGVQSNLEELFLSHKLEVKRVNEICRFLTELDCTTKLEGNGR